MSDENWSTRTEGQLYVQVHVEWLTGQEGKERPFRSKKRLQVGGVRQYKLELRVIAAR